MSRCIRYVVRSIATVNPLRLNNFARSVSFRVQPSFACLPSHSVYLPDCISVRVIMSKVVSNKIKTLEKEVKSLRSSLEAKELQVKEALTLKSDKQTSLEQQISEANILIESTNGEIATTNEMIKDLQDKLTKAEAAAVEDRLAAETKALSLKQTAHKEKQKLIGAVHDVVGSPSSVDRETRMIQLLERAKADKEKAIRVLIKIAGKNKIADFLEHNAGSPDLLDRLEDMLLSGRSPSK